MLGGGRGGCCCCRSGCGSIVAGGGGRVAPGLADAVGVANCGPVDAVVVDALPVGAVVRLYLLEI